MTTTANTQFWDERRGRIQTKKGGWRIGQGVLSHGYSMLDDLVGHVSYMQVMILNVTGCLPEKRLADWIEAVHICLSWPDARIWCNQIGALAGSARTSPVAATCAGIMAQDSRAYGARTLVPGMNFIQGALLQRKSGKTAAKIVEDVASKLGGKPKIVGYARPIAKGDERIPPMERVTSNLGFNIGPHLELAYAIENILVSGFDESMNISGYVSAFLSDQGLTSQEAYRIFSTLSASGVIACYSEQFDSVPGSFLPLRCDDISYKGAPARELPDT